MQPLLLSGIHTWEKVAFQDNTFRVFLSTLCMQFTVLEKMVFQSVFQKKTWRDTNLLKFIELKF